MVDLRQLMAVCIAIAFVVTSLWALIWFWTHIALAIAGVFDQ